ncbi:MAG: VWA domain-containing protein [Geminicoccaceae bacterium]
MKRVGLILCLGLLTLGAGSAEAQNRRPLLIEGKTELFQRVLTRPGAKIAEGVGAPGETALDPFTPLFVYERHPVDGGGPTYLEVGSDAKGTVLGFLPEQETVPWRHALVLAFSDRVRRDRTLFFREESQLSDWLDSTDLLVKAEEARSAIDEGTLEPGSPIVSIEPEAHVDFEENFYLLPILEANRKRLKSGFRVRNVEVASVTREEATEEPPLKKRINPRDLDDFRAGVMFVIDASSSMGPYITRTRAVVDGVLKRVEEAGLEDKVRFGLIAYRDDPEEVEGVEFLTKTFADPNDIQGAADFAAAVQPLEASEVSTRAFAEDSFAAIDAAFSSVDWRDFGARYIILVTDASSRTARPEEVGGKVVPPSDTGLSVTGMHQVIRSNKAALYTLHLQSPVGADDHPRAEAQYRTLRRFETLPPLYYPVAAGDPETFSKTVETLASALVGQVQGAFDTVTATNEPEPEPELAGPVGIEQSVQLVGRAMALAHLGRAEGVEAPSMFRAWASDRDFANPEIRNFSVRVLLSRNQLSDLQKTLQLTVDALEAGQIDPDDMFNQLRSAAIAAGRDPSRTGQGELRNMEEAGLVGEYLEGLPYQSRLMSLTEDDWIAMGVGDQQAIIDEAYANIRLYQTFHDDAERWIALNEGADPGDHVYPVPLEALP